MSETLLAVSEVAQHLSDLAVTRSVDQQELPRGRRCHAAVGGVEARCAGLQEVPQPLDPLLES